VVVGDPKAINTDLLDWIVRQIEDTPENWNQDSWTSRDGCQTTFCIAGWAAFLTDHVDGYGYPTTKGIKWADSTKEGWLISFCAQPGHRELNFELLARELLWLDEDQADVLFDAHSFMGADDDYSNIRVGVNPNSNRVDRIRPVIKEHLGVDLGERPAGDAK